MSTLKSDMIRRNLGKKGFNCINGSKHWMLSYEYEGIRTGIHSAMSKGKDEISDPLINKMAKDVMLKTKEFIDLSVCKMTKEDYENIVKKKGYLKQ